MAVAESFSFESLSKQEAEERKSPRLTKIGGEFWSELFAYLDRLETEYLKAHADDPAARRTILLSDEFRNAMRKAEALWEARQRKITFHAMKTARQEKPGQPDNITKAERPFHEELLEVFRKYRREVFEPRGRGPAPTKAPATKPPAAPEAPANTEAKPAPATKTEAKTDSGKAEASVTKKPEAGDDAIATVRALVDIPPFVGLDSKTYKLKKGEVATIPRKMAEILRKNGKVAPVS